MRLLRRSLMSFELGASRMLNVNRFEYHTSEYWYIGSITARSTTQKNSDDARNATGRYSSREASISFSVFSA